MIEASHNDLLLHNFEFSPKRLSDIAAHIDSSFEPIECYWTFYKQDFEKTCECCKQLCKNKMSGEQSCIMTIYSTWVPVTKVEVLHYLAVTIAMDLQLWAELPD